MAKILNIFYMRNDMTIINAQIKQQKQRKHLGL